MLSVGFVVTGVSLFLVGTGLVAACCPSSEKEQIQKIYEEIEFEKKKEKLMPIRNADINLFGVLKY